MQIKTFLSAVAAAALASAQDTEGSETTLVDLISGQENLSALTALLSSFPELAETLAGTEGVTVFAPSNEALASIEEEGGIFSIEEAAMDADLIEAVLRYHILTETVTSDAVTEEPQFLPTLLDYTVFVQDGDVTGSNVTGGQVIQCALSDGNVVLTSGLMTESNVVEADLEYNNGVVHIIDQLLTIPMSASDTLVFSGLDELAQAATTADLITTLDSLEDVTIFAPSNEAFEAIADVAADLSPEELATILTYHVVQGTVAYSPDVLELAPEASLETVEGSELTITVSDDGEIMVNDARVVTPNVLVAGGVVHVIDAVLMPEMGGAAPMPNGTMPGGNGTTYPPTVPSDVAPPEQTGAGASLSAEGALGLAVLFGAAAFAVNL